VQSQILLLLLLLLLLLMLLLQFLITLIHDVPKVFQMQLRARLVPYHACRPEHIWLKQSGQRILVSSSASMEPQTPERPIKRRKVDLECLSPEKSPEPAPEHVPVANAQHTSSLPSPSGLPQTYGAYITDASRRRQDCVASSSALHVPLPEQFGIGSVAHASDPQAQVFGPSVIATKIRAGLTVKCRSIGGRARGDRTYTVITRVADREWEVEDDITHERKQMHEEEIAVARKKRKTKGTDDAKDDAHEGQPICDVLNGWHKIGCTSDPAVVWYRLGMSEVKCITFNPSISLAPSLCHKHIVTSHLPERGTCTAGEQLRRAVETVRHQTQATAAFKLGMTSNPFKRWGYYVEEERGWSRLVLLGVGEVAETIAMLESSLIHTFKNDAKCQNKAPGGEGLAQMKRVGQPYFAYVEVSFL
jgi:hypothetical protein